MHQRPLTSYVEGVEDWLLSSAKDYAGRKGLLDICLLTDGSSGSLRQYGDSGWIKFSRSHVQKFSNFQI
jgi:hypothetical protein